MRFTRGVKQNITKRDDVVPTVRVCCIPLGSGNKSVKGNISRSITVKNARVSDVMKAIEKVLFAD